MTKYFVALNSILDFPAIKLLLWVATFEKHISHLDVKILFNATKYFECEPSVVAKICDLSDCMLPFHQKYSTFLTELLLEM